VLSASPKVRRVKSFWATETTQQKTKVQNQNYTVSKVHIANSLPGYKAIVVIKKVLIPGG